MPRARHDAPVASRARRAVDACGPIIELVSTTGARDLAVLVYRSAEVDETAFAPHETTTARVYGLAVRIGPASTPEVAPESCREVWRTSTRFDADRSSAMAWIMAIAHRRAVDRLRSARDTTSPPPLAPARSLGRRARRHAHQERHTRHDQASHAEVAQVREALAGLDPEQCEALELAYFERYSDARSADLATILDTIVTTSLAPDSVVPDGPPLKDSPVWPPDREAS